MREQDIHIGDVLRVRQWDDMVDEYGYDDADKNKIATPKLRFNTLMTPLCGRQFTVMNMIRRYYGVTYISEEGIEIRRDVIHSSREVTRWLITAEMLEPDIPECEFDPPSDSDIAAFLFS